MRSATKATTQGDPGLAGHRSIAGTAVYTALAPNRFKRFHHPEVLNPFRAVTFCGTLTGRR
jgi:hypothetical protein